MYLSMPKPQRCHECEEGLRRGGSLLLKKGMISVLRVFNRSFPLVRHLNKVVTA